MLRPMTWTILGALLLTVTARAEETAPLWPQWRGPTRDGLVGGPAWPATLQGDALRPSWRVELGSSYSGPIVAADRVFTTETRDKKYEVVRALDRKTGKELWRHEWEGSLSVPFFARSNGDWIRSTPAYDGESLYVAGMRDVLVCLDAATGRERWKLDLADRFRAPLPAFGFVCSPLVDGDYLYVQAAASLLKLNKKTGDTVWRTLTDEGGMMGSAFSSPALATLAGQRQLLVQTRTRLAGVSETDGRVLWSRDIPAFRGMNILTPAPFGDGVFTSAYGTQSYFFSVARDGDAFTATPAWTAKAEAYMSTPVVIDGHAYLHLKNQRLTCLDLKTGRVCWTSPQSFGKYLSLVAQKDRILALDERGLLLHIRATPEKFDLLDTRKVSDADTWAHLAVAGDELFVRERTALAAFRWTGPAR